MKITFLNWLSAITLFWAIVSSSTLYAEDPEFGAEPKAEVDCLVGVRVIKGGSRSEDFVRKKLTTGMYLKDVKSQLEPLPFSKYRVVDSAQKHVKLGETGEFSVFDETDRHSLFIQPSKINRSRVQVMVNWMGPSGESLLSTKLGIVKGKNVVVGTDTDGDSSTILCIKVDCKQ